MVVKPGFFERTTCVTPTAIRKQSSPENIWT